MATDRQPAGPPRRLGPDEIVAEVQVIGAAGEIGDTMLVIGPDHPLWGVWDAYLPPTTVQENKP